MIPSLFDGVCASNHMFGKAIWDKLPKGILKILKFPPKKREIAKLLKFIRVIYAKNHPNQTCDYCLITLNQQTLCIGTNRF